MLVIYLDVYLGSDCFQSWLRNSIIISLSLLIASLGYYWEKQTNKQKTFPLELWWGVFSKVYYCWWQVQCQFHCPFKPLPFLAGLMKSYVMLSINVSVFRSPLFSSERFSYFIFLLTFSWTLSQCSRVKMIFTSICLSFAEHQFWVVINQIISLVLTWLSFLLSKI